MASAVSIWREGLYKSWYKFRKLQEGVKRDLAVASTEEKAGSNLVSYIVQVQKDDIPQSFLEGIHFHLCRPQPEPNSILKKNLMPSAKQ